MGGIAVRRRRGSYGKSIGGRRSGDWDLADRDIDLRLHFYQCKIR